MIENNYSKPELIEEYLNNGWKFGCKNKIYNK